MSDARPPKVTIVVPCFNEEEVLPNSARKLGEILDGMVDRHVIDGASYILFVDDGSQDATWKIIEDLSRSQQRIYAGVKLSRNQGHQRALLAGLKTAQGDAVISIDADLQHDVSVIEEMIRNFTRGIDIVYGVRKDRKTDTRFKRLTGDGYYWLMKRLGVDIVPDHADFRLMSRRAIDALSRYTEVNIFLRALVRQLGFSSTIVTYDQFPRPAGCSKYSLRKMVSLAADGVTSFSMRPLRFITLAGFAISLVAFGFGFWALLLKIFSKTTVPGWTSIVAPLSFIGGLQLFALGIIGEYIGKIYLETKRRPLFEIETIVGPIAAARISGEPTLHVVEQVRM